MIRFLQPWGLLALLPVAAVAGAYLWQWRRRVHAVVQQSGVLRAIAVRSGVAPARSAGGFPADLVACRALARPAIGREGLSSVRPWSAIDVSLSGGRGRRTHPVGGAGAASSRQTCPGTMSGWWLRP